MVEEVSKVSGKDDINNFIEFSYEEEKPIPDDIIEIIQSRVILIEENIVIFNSLPKKIINLSKIMFEKMDELTIDLDNYTLIRIFTDTETRGNAEYRDWIYQQLKERIKLKHISFVVPLADESIIRMLVKFTMAKIDHLSYSVDNSLSDAITTIRELGF
ncbi:MAG: hypothetical protein OEZ01_12350 [Candidatus Heimdallarchaeota archaeon]|nr:hypothetical protein [Candidatus Heimdallarchaeota archaeon]MDH5646796.1 hypothetical protein [Candidatus Heimdallarchaeota archaeon]